jgi:outer membrane lipoprotein SlyB
MNHFHTLHGSAWSGAGTVVVGVWTGDQISQWTGIAIAVLSAAVAGALTLYGRVQDERRKQEWLDFELRQRMRAQAGQDLSRLDTTPDRQAGGLKPNDPV